ncbi:MAG TPA: hypothetical protein VK054_00575 [Beutenbergiaceae bacterium]|nr:hypothetical protein [Beutenbergiaceae bacterium]
MPGANKKQITVKGVTLSVDPEVFDDLDMLDALDQIQEGNGLRIAGALRKIAGDQYNELRAALRDEATGRIPVNVVGEVFTEIMAGIVPN